MNSVQANGLSQTEAQSLRKPRRPNYNFIHRNLLPVEIHPLPPLIPHNPISILTITLTYLFQIFAPPERPTYNGYFSSATSSVHVTDPETVRALWEMGFFGRGSLSRSEPTWKQNQTKAGIRAEENTEQRRAERRQQKRIRAQKEQEVITEQLSKEALPNGGFAPNILKTNDNDFNGIADVLKAAEETHDQEIDNLEPLDNRLNKTPMSLQTLESEGNISKHVPEVQSLDSTKVQQSEHIEGYVEWKRLVDANGLPTPPPTSTSSESSQTDPKPSQTLQRQKTVRFSPTIEAREFDLSSPIISPIKSPGSAAPITHNDDTGTPSENKEHLHISLEEAFFLSYALGVLKIYCDDSDAVLPPASLLSLFRRHSYQPYKSISIPAEVDDPFMLSYAVYHHYRSLGWIVRSGVKFGVDYLLYNRGPAFSHADFAVVAVPSYTDDPANMSENRLGSIKQKTRHTWWWLHGINRVQAQVYKQLVLTYVEIPQTSNEERKVEADIGKLFSRYRIRDVNVKRWTPNRARG